VEPPGESGAIRGEQGRPAPQKYVMNQSVPNTQYAIVDRRKLDEYLLSPHHPVGRNKAHVFAHCGYDLGHIDELVGELKRIVTEGQLVEVIESPYGSKYIVDGKLDCAHGTTLGIRTVWIVEIHSLAPRFVTAYPV